MINVYKNGEVFTYCDNETALKLIFQNKAKRISDNSIELIN